MASTLKDTDATRAGRPAAARAAALRGWLALTADERKALLLVLALALLGLFARQRHLKQSESRLAEQSPTGLEAAPAPGSFQGSR